VNCVTATCGVGTASLPENADGTTGRYGLTGEVIGNDVELFATTCTQGDDNASYPCGILLGRLRPGSGTSIG